MYTTFNHKVLKQLVYNSKKTDVCVPVCEFSV